MDLVDGCDGWMDLVDGCDVVNGCDGWMRWVDVMGGSGRWM